MDVHGFKNFQEVGQSVLKFLHARYGFDLWMITRVEDKDWIVLQSEDYAYDVKPGHVFCWEDSFCSHMVKGKAPCIAPRSEEIPLYANAPIAQQVPIKAYIGQPLYHEDGSIFGTICAVDPQPQPKSLLDEAPLIEQMAALLSYILQAELRASAQLRQVERLQVEALTDHLTSLVNRRGWDHVIDAEEARCKLYGHPVAIIIIDLNDLKITNDLFGHSAGDQLIRSTANILKHIIPTEYLVARLGGDEFGVLCTETHHDEAEQLVQTILSTLEHEKISAAVGLAMRDPSKGLSEATIQADLNMYRNKRQRSQQSRFNPESN